MGEAEGGAAGGPVAPGPARRGLLAGAGSPGAGELRSASRGTVSAGLANPRRLELHARVGVGLLRLDELEFALTGSKRVLKQREHA